MNSIIIGLEVALFLGIVVFIHELGHFFMAKKRGVKVEKFSLGFGPKIIGIKKGDTEYLLSAIPFGGYVKIFGENPDEESNQRNCQRMRFALRCRKMAGRNLH